MTEGKCEDCPPLGYPTDITRCKPCPISAPDYFEMVAQRDTIEKVAADRDAIIKEMHAALVEAKRELWMTARLHYTLSDFKNFAVTQQIDRALTLVDGKVRS